MTRRTLLQSAGLALAGLCAATRTAWATITRSTWQPDTCPAPGCLFVEDIDNATGSRIYVSTTRVCPAHQGIVDPREVFNACVQENTAKNLVERALLTLTKYTQTISGAVVLKDGLEYRWSFDGADKGRVLHVSVTGATLSTTEKSALVAAASALTISVVAD